MGQTTFWIARALSEGAPRLTDGVSDEEPRCRRGAEAETGPKLAMGLKDYHRKRDFKKTSEPKGADPARRARGKLSFVIQKHAARRLHYDFRLEMEGVLRSWAVPKGPSFDPRDKRLAVHVEDHPLEYGSFEGIIPQGEYGGGAVILWDRGVWTPKGDPVEGYRRGRLELTLEGKKLHGSWALVRMSGDRGEGGKNWLLIKKQDEIAKSGYDVTEEMPLSVKSGRSVEQIAAKPGRVWRSNRSEKTSLTPSSDTGLESRPVRRGSSKADEPYSKRSPIGSKRSSTSRPAAASAAPPRRRVQRGSRGGEGRAHSTVATVDPSSLPGARKRPYPRDLPGVEMATLVAAVPTGEEWLHEIKYDGYRMMAVLRGGRARLITRNRKDWTGSFPTLTEEMERWPETTAILDGEVVALDEKGISDFQRLQNALSGEERARLVYFVFDLLYLDGWDLSPVPLESRKAALQSFLARVARAEGPIRYSDHMIGRGAEFFDEACRLGLEGLVSKTRTSVYRSGRSKDWLKTKCLKRQELVVGGYTDPAGSRTGLGSLLLGYYDDRRKLIYAGRAGTGFTQRSLEEIRRRLESLKRDTAPFANPPRERGLHWVEPSLVAEVEFQEWTREGVMRHPRFRGLREDKPSSQVVKETPDRGSDAGSSPPRSRGRASSRKTTPARRGPTRPESDREGTIEGVKLTNPDRVLYQAQGITKLDLARYYQRVAPFMLPHVQRRPLMLLRCPRGQGQPCFIQKHGGESVPDAVLQVEIQEGRGKAIGLAIEDAAGLLSLVQMGALEIHAWGARVDHIEKPVVMIFDLDPDPSVEWKRVMSTALEIRERLEHLGLVSFVKTTGGKGLHVTVPLRPKATWESVREFTRALAGTFVKDRPSEYTIELSKARRHGKILIDWMRNGRGATAIVPYSSRAREGAPVAAPLRWEEVGRSLDPARFTIEAMLRRTSEEDPWKDYADVRQSLTLSMMKTLGVSS